MDKRELIKNFIVFTKNLVETFEIKDVKNFQNDFFDLIKNINPQFLDFDKLELDFFEILNKYKTIENEKAKETILNDLKRLGD
jgi:hypothetical protein